MRLWGWVLGWMACLGCGVGSAAAQAVQPIVDGTGRPTTVVAALHEMSDRAAVVFVGTVMAVRRVGGDPTSAATGVVEVDFAVEQAVRGCTTGGTYTLREWAGMWAGTSERYRVGQRMFLMLHAPSASGLSSPVRGAEGAIRIRGGGGTVGEKDSTTGEHGPVVDLRWVGAKLGRPVVYRRETATGALGAAGGVLAAERRASAGMSRVFDSGVATADAEVVAAPAPEASVAAQEAAVSTVVKLLATWTRGE